jgi:DNA processing protein
MPLPISIQFCLGLQSIDGLGLKTLDHLLQYFDSIASVAEAEFDALCRSGLRTSLAHRISQRSWLGVESFQRQLDRIEQWLTVPGHHLICIDDARYPSQLRQIHCAPWLLYVRGQPEILERQALAIVGSRKPSIDGLRCARAFAAALAQLELVVHSGLAVGIDAAAHQGVLDAQGQTSAVLATGIDRIYPAQHQRLSEQIVERGALVSEMPLGTAPQPQNFPRRNRLISGLSRGVLVVEAGVKSGSLITARYALEQNRDVFALPGSVFNLQARGPHALIKAGAKLVEDVTDIVSEWVYPAPVSLVQNMSEPIPDRPPLNEGERRVLAKMGFEVMSFDALMVETELDYSALSSILVTLELQGALRQVPGGYQRVYQVESGL